MTEIDGYFVIDLGLSQPKYSLTVDAQIRCLSFLIAKVRADFDLPNGAQFVIIPVKYLGI